MAASAPLIWIFTHGRRGDMVQCRAIAEGLSDRIIAKTIAPRPPYRWLMPHGPIDPREQTLVAPPYPDLIIASGRRTVPYVRHVYRKSKGACRSVFMKYPGCDVSHYGLTWCPDHDRRIGHDVISTLTTPHLVTQDLLAHHRQHPDERIAALPTPHLGILLGGNNRKARYDAQEISTFCDKLRNTLPFASYLVTGSRRTPTAFLKAIEKTLSPRPTFIWNNKGDNPYFSILANASTLLVTGDSHNLMSEAIASGKAVHIYKPRQNAKKFDWFIAEARKRQLIMEENADLRPQEGPLHDATPGIIAEIKQRFHL